VIALAERALGQAIALLPSGRQAAQPAAFAVERRIGVHGDPAGGVVPKLSLDPPEGVRLGQLAGQVD
jgi:hypothetical protein